MDIIVYSYIVQPPPEVPRMSMASNGIVNKHSSMGNE